MLADQLFQFLTRSEVKEIALHTGRPPCALVDETYRRLSAQSLREDDIITVLSAARGHDHLAHLADGRSWEFQHPAVGVIVVSAIYDASGIKAMLRLRDRPGAAPPEPPKRPSRAPRAKRNSVPPKRPSVRPARRSQRPPRPPGMPPQPPAADPIEAPTATLGTAVPRRPARPPSDGVSLPPPAPPEELLSGYGMSLPAAPMPPGGRPSSSANFAAVSARPASSQSMPAVRPPSRQDFQAVPAAADRRQGLQELSAPPGARALSRPVMPPFHGDQFDDLLRAALERRASDMLVVAERPVLFRIAGELLPHGAPLPAAEVEAMLATRVPDAKRDELAQAGSCDFGMDHPVYGRFRVNVGRQRTGLKLTARMIGAAIPTLEELGMPLAIRKALHHHQGLIVVTGPTGHGKTTTMAAIVGIINRETTHHVITVEDPIEYTHPFAKAVISQREVGSHTKTFAAALKASLREDPDVIVVGELRDTETVRMALSASETGHLVISTMNTPSAAKAIERLIDLFPPGDQPQVRMTLAGGLRLIISQRLMPTADRKQLCAAAEILPGSTALWSLIRDNRTYQIPSLQQRGKSLGIVRLDDSLAELVRSGRTTLEIARDYADAPQHLEALVAGRPVQAPPEAAAPGEDSNAERAAAAAKRGVEMGKSVLSRAGKLFGNESK
ncbi:MAG TPA: PilT/PilU family type 4a pilus ATPase [Polyangiales bacterium]|nr:PilT/PilU family type 4a pilus ATPase [Polyangiales bacterium]